MPVFRSVVSASLAFMLFLPAARADQLADIRSRGVLTCGVLGTDEPNSFVDPATRQVVGYEADLCRAVAAKIGVKPVFKQMAVAARIPELQQGRIDLLAASLTHTKEREAQIDFSVSTLVFGQKVMVKKSSGVTSVAQLAGKKVLTSKGGTQEPNIRRAVPTVNVTTFETVSQAFLALQQGKGAGYVDDEQALLTNYAKLGPAQKDYLVLPESISTEAMAIGIRKGEPAFKALVDDLLRSMEKSGDATKLFNKWYGPGTRLNMQKRSFTFSSDKI
jgi:polar amino acid transport system substrate-binding protein